MKPIKNTMIIGIDPGKSGGIAFKREGQPAQAVAMPATEGDLVELIRSIVDDPANTTAYIEEVSGFAGTPQPGSAMFKFGRGFGFLLGVLQTLRVRVQLVKPAKWQKTLSLGNSKDCPDKTAWKNKLKGESQRLFPDMKVTLSTADALLIMTFALNSEAVAHPSETDKEQA